MLTKDAIKSCCIWISISGLAQQRANFGPKEDTYEFSVQWAAVKINLSEIWIEVQVPDFPSKYEPLLVAFNALNLPHSMNDESKRYTKDMQMQTKSCKRFYHYQSLHYPNQYIVWFLSFEVLCWTLKYASY